MIVDRLLPQPKTDTRWQDLKARLKRPQKGGSISYFSINIAAAGSVKILFVVGEE